MSLVREQNGVLDSVACAEAMDVIGKLPVVKGAVTRLRLENLQ